MNLASRIELWPIDRLQPYARNPRTHSKDQVVKIARSIKEFGFTNPILVDSEHGIIAGHGRLMAAKSLGMIEVPVIELTHLTPAQRRAYMIADNKLPNEAGWDNQLLYDMLEELKSEQFDVTLTGFSESDLQRLADDLDEQELAGMAGDNVGQDTTANEGGREKTSASTGLVPFSAVIEVSQRDQIFSAIKIAKEAHGVESTGEALFIICREWINAQG